MGRNLYRRGGGQVKAFERVRERSGGAGAQCGCPWKVGECNRNLQVRSGGFGSFLERHPTTKHEYLKEPFDTVESRLGQQTIRFNRSFFASARVLFSGNDESRCVVASDDFCAARWSSRRGAAGVKGS